MKTILVIGLGRFGRHLAENLLAQGHEVLAIEIDETRADEALATVPNVQIGDATNENLIRTLGVNHFDVCVVTIGDHFQSALETTVLLKDFGAPCVVARASRDVHKKLLLRNGADQVVYAEREMAERLAVKYGADNIFDYIELTPEYGIYEIAVPPAWCGKTILEKAVRSRYHISILAVKQNGELSPLPHPDHVFTAGETLMVLSTHENIRNVTK